MYHCPNCGYPVKDGEKFCPNCGQQLQQQPQQNQPNYNQMNNQQPIPPRQPPHRKHHGFRNTIIVIALLAVCAGGYYMYNKPNNSQSTTSSRQASNKPSSNPSNSGNSNNNQTKPNNNSQKSNNTKKRQIKIPTKKNTARKPKPANNQPKTRPGYTLTAFPKAIQGKWYSYDNGKLDTMTITNNSFTDSDGDDYTIHSRPIKTDGMKASKHDKWLVCLPPKNIHGLRMVDMLTWNQGTVGEWYGIINYKGMPVLETAGGVEEWLDGNYFKSKAQAQQNKKKKLPHEIKRPD